MTRPFMPMLATSAEKMSTSMLASVAALDTDEVVLMQWVIAPAFATVPPSDGQVRSSQFNLARALNGNFTATKDEVDQRPQKLEDHDILTSGHIVT